MVFHSLIKKKETPPESSLDPSMASSTTVKSQPLHNFSLPDLKWAMNHANTHRFRKLSDCSSHKSPRNDADCESEYPKQNPILESGRIGDGIDKSDKKKPAAAVLSDDLVENSEKKLTGSSDGSRSKIFIKIRTKNCKTSDEVADTGDHASVAAEDAEESVPKTWNLRPRRVITKVNNNATGGASKIGGAAVQDHKAQPPTRNRNIVTTEAKVPEKKEREKEKKQKFSISLTKEEIENDILILTGSKPARRPKKRAKNVQKQLDFVFPGLWLASITPDSYRVNDGPAKV
ncbi:uncharacterized protein LOC123215745 [Mangifera indica]|uniref:uncharacterized protein LOC123215745 n=1 Tax=Mangifera indica TaxID=29780 RepID=UPI001CFBA319|nr:uncharacterized protein LOC123215745 [Mangifera indica]